MFDLLLAISFTLTAAFHPIVIHWYLRTAIRIEDPYEYYRLENQELSLLTLIALTILLVVKTILSFVVEIWAIFLGFPFLIFGVCGLVLYVISSIVERRTRSSDVESTVKDRFEELTTKEGYIRHHVFYFVNLLIHFALVYTRIIHPVVVSILESYFGS
jgi:hypothetical protein